MDLASPAVSGTSVYANGLMDLASPAVSGTSVYANGLIITVPTRWPRGRRRRPVAARLLGLRVSISPEVWTFVSCEWCVLLQVETSATGWSPIQGGPIDSEGVIACDYVQQWPDVDSVTLLSHVALFGSITVFSLNLKLAQLHYSVMFSTVNCIALFSHICFSWLC